MACSMRLNCIGAVDCFQEPAVGPHWAGAFPRTALGRLIIVLADLDKPVQHAQDAWPMHRAANIPESTLRRDVGILAPFQERYEEVDVLAIVVEGLYKFGLESTNEVCHDAEELFLLRAGQLLQTDLHVCLVCCKVVDNVFLDLVLPFLLINGPVVFASRTML